MKSGASYWSSGQNPSLVKPDVGLVQPSAVVTRIGVYSLSLEEAREVWHRLGEVLAEIDGKVSGDSD